MLAKLFGYVLSLSTITYQQNSVRTSQTFFAMYTAYKFNVQMWKMWTIWGLFQCYFATFKQKSIRIIQKLCSFGCKSYFMCKL